MSDLDTFMSNNLPQGKSAKLERFAEDIRILKESGYSELQILDYLSSKKNLTVSRPTLSRFIRSHLKNPGGAASKQTEEIRSVSKLTKSANPPRDIQTSAQNQPSVSGKFDWQKKIPDEDMF